VNTNQSRPIHAAAASGSTEVVTLLLEAGAKVTVPDGEGRTCDRIATERGHVSLAEMLRTKRDSVVDTANRAASAATAAAYAAAAKGSQGIIPITTPVEHVIAQGLVSLAIAGDIINGGRDAETHAEGAPAAAAPSDADDAYARKNIELEAQLVDVERKLRLDRLYASRPERAEARVYA
jgi:hypothetical protein